MQEFRDRVAVVTGGASGIGRAMAERFAAAGMRLVLADVEEAALAATVAGVRGVGGHRDRGAAPTCRSRPTSTRCATGPSTRSARCTSCATTPGSAGAGSSTRRSSCGSGCSGVNLFGVVHGVHTFLPLLLEQDEGHIVNTASLAGLGGVGGLGVYCTSKFAVVGSERIVALRPRGTSECNVGVSVLCPGFVQTQIGESARNAPASLSSWQASDDAAVDARDGRARSRRPGSLPSSRRRRGVRRDRRATQFFVVPHAHAAHATTRARLEWMQGGDPPALDPSRRALQP